MLKTIFTILNQGEEIISPAILFRILFMIFVISLIIIGLIILFYGPSTNNRRLYLAFLFSFMIGPCIIFFSLDTTEYTDITNRDLIFGIGVLVTIGSITFIIISILYKHRNGIRNLFPHKIRMKSPREDNVSQSKKIEITKSRYDKLMDSKRRKFKARVVPIVGPPGSGKTWFICALDWYLHSKPEAHYVLNKEGRDYLLEKQGEIIKNRTLDSTEKKHLVEIYIDPLKLNLGFTSKQLKKKGLILTSGDISGESFISRDESFIEFVKKTDMLLILLDKNDLYDKIMGDRLAQISQSIETALEFNKLKIISFILTKNDNEIIPHEQLKARFEEMCLPILGKLRFLHIQYEILSCSALGSSDINEHEPLKPEGFDVILRNLAELCLLKRHLTQN